MNNLSVEDKLVVFVIVAHHSLVPEKAVKVRTYTEHPEFMCCRINRYYIERILLLFAHRPVGVRSTSLQPVLRGDADMQLIRMSVHIATIVEMGVAIKPTSEMASIVDEGVHRIKGRRGQSPDARGSLFA